MFLKLLNPARIYLVVLLILFIPLYPKFPLVGVPGSFVFVRLEDILIAIIFLFWFLAELPNRFRFASSPAGIAILLYWAVGSVSLFSAIFLTKTVSPSIGLLHTLRRVEYMAIFLISYTFFTHLSQLRFIINSILIVSVIVALYGLGQRFLAFPVITTNNSEFSKGLALSLSDSARINSTFAGHYDLAAFTVFPLLLIIGLLLSNLTTQRSKLILIIAAGLIYYCLLLSASRVTFAAFYLTSTLFIIILRRPFYLAPLLVLGVVSVIVSPQLLGRYQEFLNNHLKFSLASPVQAAPIDEQIPDALQPATTIEDRSLNIRLNVEWPRAIRSFLKNPVLGTGFSSVGLAVDNDYLRALAETGLLGFISLGMVFYYQSRGLLKFVKLPLSDLPHLFVSSLLCAFIGLLLNAIFIDILEASKIAIMSWLYLGIAFKTRILYDQK